MCCSNGFGVCRCAKEKRATCYPGFEKRLTGAEHTGELCTIDGNITTGKGPAAAFIYGFAILEQLTSAETAQEVKDGMLISELISFIKQLTKYHQTMNYIIIVAGGKGLRMGSDIPKQFLPVGNKPVLMRTISRFHEYDKSINIILVLPKEQQAYWKELCDKYHSTKNTH